MCIRDRSGIDQQMYEAAQIDGAGKWKQMLYITLPGLKPTIVIMLILRLGSILSVGYEKIILLYNPLIYETSDVISDVYKRQTGSLNAEPGDIFLKLLIVIKEARRFYNYRFAVLFNDKHLVVYGVVGVVGMELYSSEVIYVHLALC